MAIQKLLYAVSSNYKLQINDKIFNSPKEHITDALIFVKLEKGISRKLISNYMESLTSISRL